MPGFMVLDGGSEHFDVEIRVLYRDEDSLRPTADAVQTSLTSMYAKAFEEIEKRLGQQ